MNTGGIIRSARHRRVLDAIDVVPRILEAGARSQPPIKTEASPVASAEVSSTEFKPGISLLDANILLVLIYFISREIK